MSTSDRMLDWLERIDEISKHYKTAMASECFVLQLKASMAELILTLGLTPENIGQHMEESIERYERLAIAESGKKPRPHLAFTAGQKQSMARRRKCVRDAWLAKYNESTDETDLFCP